jgi:hypothetical protein
MAKTLRFRVHNCKAVSKNSLMVFDLAIGYQDEDTFVGVVDVRGCWLKQKNDGSGNYVSFPSKQRFTRDGEAVKDDNGYNVYDNIVDLYLELGANPDKADKRAPTKAAWAFRKWLIDEATKMYKELGASAPAAAAPAAKPASKPASKPAPAPMPDADDDDGDGGYPF